MNTTMKKMKTLFLVALFCMGAVEAMYGQSKVAHINTQELIAQMPEMVAAQKELDTYEKTLSAEIETEYTRYQNLVRQYSTEAESQTDVTNKKRSEELANLERSITKQREDAATEMAKKQKIMLEPLFNQAKAAIEKVAKAKGFDYVIDSTPQGGVILADGTDLMNDVKTELGF